MLPSAPSALASKVETVTDSMSKGCSLIRGISQLKHRTDSFEPMWDVHAWNSLAPGTPYTYPVS